MVQQQRVPLEERMARLEGLVQGIDLRLEGLERRMDGLERRMDAFERRLDTFEDRMARRLETLAAATDGGLRELRQRQDRLFWMILAVLLPMWMTIILAIVMRTPR